MIDKIPPEQMPEELRRLTPREHLLAIMISVWGYEYAVPIADTAALLERLAQGLRKLEERLRREESPAGAAERLLREVQGPGGDAQRCQPRQV